jgi:2-polyprenyl-3-methyl-5-hydroxy-6-metoxy-1,4-benzoquinol methylase
LVGRMQQQLPRGSLVSESFREGAMPAYLPIDPTGHVTVAAALGRLGRQGGWDRLRAGMPLSSVDLIDADLVLAAGVLSRSGTDTFAVTDPDLAVIDGDVLADGISAQLRRALAHVDRQDVGWSGVDPELVMSQGRSSRAGAEFIARELLPAMPGSRAAIESGSGRFLDVGVGVGAICIRLCQLYDGLHCVGLDVLDEPLKLAAAELAKHGLTDRVELRRQSVTELTDEVTYDLAWLPQVFIPRAAFEEGCRRVQAALRPDRWVVVPIAASTANDAFESAVFAHTAHLVGGGPMDPSEAVAVLTAAGFVEPTPKSWRGQVLVVARRP